MSHLLDHIPEVTAGGDDFGVPDSQAIIAEKIDVGPLIIERGTPWFVEDMMAGELAAIDRGLIPDFLAQPDKTVAPFPPGQPAVWNCLFVAHRFHPRKGRLACRPDRDDLGPGFESV